ncbi:MAG: hypothetical protein KGQ41_08275 [Alphaproteobacteria bacterium]|nr:hypothetical protein [Alphaproteobacteria bacterium]
MKPSVMYIVLVALFIGAGLFAMGRIQNNAPEISMPEQNTVAEQQMYDMLPSATEDKDVNAIAPAAGDATTQKTADEPAANESEEAEESSDEE